MYPGKGAKRVAASISTKARSYLVFAYHTLVKEKTTHSKQALHGPPHSPTWRSSSARLFDRPAPERWDHDAWSFGDGRWVATVAVFASLALTGWSSPVNKGDEKPRVAKTGFLSHSV